jgi:hypothetical protein
MFTHALFSLSKGRKNWRRFGRENQKRRRVPFLNRCSKEAGSLVSNASISLWAGMSKVVTNELKRTEVERIKSQG